MDTHAEVARNFMDLMQDSTKFEVVYYFSDKILKQLNVKENSNIIKVTADTLNEKIADHNSNNEIFELIIIGTAHRYFKQFLDISAVLKTVIIVHNLNFVKLNSIQLFQNIFKKDILFRLKLLLKEGLFQKNKLYQSTKRLLILDNFITNDDKFQYLPLISSLNFKSKCTEDLSIVIPGSVSQARRDYKSVLIKIKNWSKINTTSKLEIVFLGKAENPELQWLKDFETKNLKGVKIVYFKEKVPQNVFDSYMKNATYLWCPLQISTSFFSNEEVYGFTKVSGIIGDAIKYKKVAFLPKAYPSNLPFIKADTEDLESQISSFSNHNTQCVFDEFSKEKVLGKLEKVLNDLVS